MRIWIKPYRKKNGELMFYVNNDRRCSIGFSDSNSFTPYQRGATKGQRKLLYELLSRLESAAPIATGADPERHTEEKVDFVNGWIAAITDVATVGGVSTGSDGIFLINAKGDVISPTELKY
jgi:hypothetical protein